MMFNYSRSTIIWTDWFQVNNVSYHHNGCNNKTEGGLLEASEGGDGAF